MRDVYPAEFEKRAQVGVPAISREGVAEAGMTPDVGEEIKAGWDTMVTIPAGNIRLELQF